MGGILFLVLLSLALRRGRVTDLLTLFPQSSGVFVAFWQLMKGMSSPMSI